MKNEIEKSINSKNITASIPKITESTNELSLFINSLPFPIFYKDKNGIYLNCNNVFADLIYGKTKEMVIGKYPHQLAISKPEETEKKYFKRDKIVYKTKKSFTYEEKIICSDNETRIFQVTKIPYATDENGGIGIMGYMLDITKNKDLMKKILNSERRYKKLFENANDALVVVSPKEGSIIDLNNRACEIYDVKRDEILGNRYTDFLKEKNEAKNIIERILTEGKLLNLDSVHYKSDNTELMVEINASVINYNGEEAILAIIRDVTDRRKNEEMMNYLLEFEIITSSISSNFVKVSLDGIDDAINFALEKLGAFFGVTLAYVYQVENDLTTIQKSHFWENPENEKKYSHSLNSNLSRYWHWHEKLSRLTSIFIKDENKLPPQAGNEKQYLSSNNINTIIMVPIVSQSKLIGFLGFECIGGESSPFDGDISLLGIISEIIGTALEQKKIDENRHVAETQMIKLSRAVEQSANMVMITDSAGVIDYINPKFSEVTGYKENEIIGKKPNLLKSGYTDPDDYDELWRTVLAGNRWEGKFQNIKKNGELYWDHTTITPIKDNENRITHYLAIKEDITEKIKKENEEAISQKMESIGHLAAGIAHEINTPMQYVGDNTSFLSDAFKDLNDLLIEIRSTIKNNSDNVCIKQLEEKFDSIDFEFLANEIPNAIEQSVTGIRRVSTLVKAMKDFAHPGAKEKSFNNINRGIEVTATISKNEWKYVAELKFELYEDMPEVYCTQDEINQVILNMIINGAHAIEEKNKSNLKSEKGIITITTKVENDYAVIIITDTGTGINKSTISNIFNPFFTTKEVGKGTGQGLAIAHDIITNKHSGVISVSSILGEGTTFVIKIPIVGENEND